MFWPEIVEPLHDAAAVVQMAQAASKNVLNVDINDIHVHSQPVMKVEMIIPIVARDE